jgi:hypothetical protein
MKIFLFLNALSIAFLFYVLVNLLCEARKQRCEPRVSNIYSDRGAKPPGLVAMIPSSRVQGGRSMIPFALGESSLSGQEKVRNRAATIHEMPVKRIPAK